MTRYGGADIGAFAEAIAKEVPTSPRDWSIDLAFHLAMALISLRKLQELGVQTTYRKKRLIGPALEDAWRQLIFIRQRYVSEKIALNDILRQVTLSKTGRVMIDASSNTIEGKQRSDNSGTTDASKQRRYRKTNPPRYRRRVSKKSTS
ncbi:MAG: hypothetical protein KAJ19_28585 [Gammaproteobacteria bacterium]|nr:hypothetical protein [Gammaproteobacteria bacterium]